MTSKEENGLGIPLKLTEKDVDLLKQLMNDYSASDKTKTIVRAALEIAEALGYVEIKKQNPGV